MIEHNEYLRADLSRDAIELGYTKHNVLIQRAIDELLAHKYHAKISGDYIEFETAQYETLFKLKYAHAF